MSRIKEYPPRRRHGLLLAVCALSALGQISIAAAAPSGFIIARVNASQGGTFTDDRHNPSVSVSIPSGALSDNARLVVRRLHRAGALGSNQTAASPAYSVNLIKLPYWKPWSRWNQPREPLTLNAPMKIEIATERAPLHPQIGEIAVYRDGAWPRMMANFYKASTNSVVTRTRNIKGEYRAAHRTLQARSGPAVERGRELFLNNTWGSERLFGTGTFQLQAVANQLTPAMAVDLGLQVNAAKLPQFMIDLFMGDDFDAKQAALNDPMAARLMMQADAVVGVKARFEDPNDPMHVTELGLTCAVCHVTVSKTPIQLAASQPPVELPIGLPVFGPPNTRLNAGGLLSASPALPVVRNGRDATLAELDWPRGSADPRFFPNNPFDDDAVNPTSIPPHWNFLDLAEQGYAATWNGVIQLRPGNDAIAAAAECGIDLVMGANGAFGTNLPQVLQGGAPNNAGITDFEIGNNLPQEFWNRLAVAEIEEPGNEISAQNLKDVQAFLQSIVSPPPGPFDEARALAGWELFYGRANCASCHSSGEGTGRTGEYFTNIVANPPQGLLSIGIKVPGLRGLAFTSPYFHDGSAATLAEVVARYTSADIPEVPSDLTAGEQAAIVEYLKSL